MTDQADKIQWHPGFYGAAELELMQDKEHLLFEREYNLGKEPLRVDLMIIKKRADVKIKNEIGRIFRQYNVLEYKSPDDGLTIDDFYKTAGYACLYKGMGETVNAVPAGELTISLFREAYPRELMDELGRMGLAVEKRFPGIYYVSGIVLFDAQIVVMKELDPQVHSGLRILSKEADEADVRRFLEQSSLYTRPGDKNNVQAVLQVSVSANVELYEAVRRDLVMCEALRELMKDEIEREKREAVEAAEKAAQKAAEKAALEQVRTTALNLHRMGMKDDFIAQAVNYNVSLVKEWIGAAEA